MFEFEDLSINPNITTYKVFQVSKMPDLFLEVEFKYPKTPSWRAYLPIFEKYQGVNFTESDKDDVIDYILDCYNDLDPRNSKIWNDKEKEYWNNHENASMAKPLFDVLNTETKYHLTGWMCRQCTDTSSVNSQAASRIRALKMTHGYHIVTKDFMCDVCGKITTHDMLIRIPRKVGNSNKRYSLPNSLTHRIKKLFNYTDACFGEKYTEGSKNLVIDHKFPSTRWAVGESPNYSSMTDEDIKAKFQLLTQQTNLQKERYCTACLLQGIRGDFFGIKWYSQGNEKWNGANNSDEKGCIGCPWYDLAEWKALFNDFLKK